MKKKSIYVALCIGLIVIAILSVTAIAQNISEENEREALLNTPGLEHLSWNEDLNEYYNGNDFIWNSDTQRYEVRLDNKELPPVDEVLTYQDWYEENKDSDDYITIALIKYCELQDEFYRVNPYLGTKGYITISEEAMAALTDLGVDAMIDMYDRIIAEDPMRSILEDALVEIAGFDRTLSYPSNLRATDERWLDIFEAAVIDASEATIISAADVENCGIFGILQAEELLADDSAASLNATDAATLNAVNAMMEEKGITREDIPAIRAFVEYIKAVHAAR